MLHDTISRKAAVFLQLSTGLSINGVLEVIRLFPNLFTKYFAHEEEATAEMFFNNLILPTNLGPEEERTIAMFRNYIESCSSTGTYVITIMYIYVYVASNAPIHEHL